MSGGRGHRHGSGTGACAFPTFRLVAGVRIEKRSAHRTCGNVPCGLLSFWTAKPPTSGNHLTHGQPKLQAWVVGSCFASRGREVGQIDPRGCRCSRPATPPFFSGGCYGAAIAAASFPEKTWSVPASARRALSSGSDKNGRNAGARRRRRSAARTCWIGSGGGFAVLPGRPRWASSARFARLFTLATEDGASPRSRSLEPSADRFAKNQRASLRGSPRRTSASRLRMAEAALPLDPKCSSCLRLTTLE